MSSNENMSRTMLPKPRLPSPKKLSELSVSENNARQNSMLPPPPPMGALKRKTLVEQAGEPPRPAPAPPSSRPIMNGGNSVKGIPRHKSFTASTSRPASSTSHHRNGSHNSFSSSVGVGKQNFSQSYRPHTSMSLNGAQRAIPGPGRPASAFDGQLQSSRNAQLDGASNSMRAISLNLRRCLSGTIIRKVSAKSSESNDSPAAYTNGAAIWSSSTPTKTSHQNHVKSRDVSISIAMSKLTVETKPSYLVPSYDGNPSCPPFTPSQIPKRKKSSVLLTTPNVSPTKSTKKKTPLFREFLTKDSNTRTANWDLGSRVENIESMYADLKASMNSSTVESNGLKESVALYKTKVSELEDIKYQLERRTTTLQDEIHTLRTEASSAAIALETMKQKHITELSMSVQAMEEVKRLLNNEIDDLKRRHRRDLDDIEREAEEGTRKLERVHREEIAELRRKLEDAVEEEKERRRKEVQALSSEGEVTKQKIESELQAKDQSIAALKSELEQSKAETTRERDITAREKELVRDLKSKLSDAASNAISMEASIASLKRHIEFLESDSKSQGHAFADLEQKTQDAIREMEEAKSKLRAEETLRRKLHNQVQELKGNIRVFCRVRPTLESDIAEKARINFPDCQEDAKEVEVLGPEEKSSLGTITTKKNGFSFDRVFSPASQNSEVFDEISQLVQSALDGYNVCIFCYGQTGSGKTYTMSSEDGMIPRAVNQIYDTAQALEEKGWTYSMEGSFVEVYNENINDLLGKAEEMDKKKHEIHHDMQKCKTTITGINTVSLDSPGKVETILRRAMNNRSVAATKANERSSRSHSVFILKLMGENSITGEKSEGTLNLVDLAGSERLSHSGATGDRLKETQSINKSLSCLGDVIGALGQGKEGGHIPYRNSKLTYLLQFSLGGNSKTLMFVMISPLQAHLSETVTSLKFATKVHNTHIGTAKRQAKIRD